MLNLQYQYFNIILEYGIRKTFTDYLDDVSTTYPGPNAGAAPQAQWPYVMSPEAQEMSDPTRTHELGEERGDPNKNDWYSFAGITLSFKIQKLPLVAGINSYNKYA